MKTLLSAEDRFAILDLLGRYSWTLDTGDYDAYTALFTPEGLLGIGVQRFQGQEAIREFIRNITLGDSWQGYQHHSSQVIFDDIDESRCRVSCYSTTTGDKDGLVKAQHIGVYRDTCVKVEGRWYFEECLWERWNAEKLTEYRRPDR